MPLFSLAVLDYRPDFTGNRGDGQVNDTPPWRGMISYAAEGGIAGATKQATDLVRVLAQAIDAF